MDKPVILLVFANETPQSHQYLRNLRFELNEVRKILRRAEEQGLCQLEILTNATIENLFDTFQSKVYRDRIAILHFSGHARSYDLLLEEAQGYSKLAAAVGLVPFLAGQKGLKLIFLNGCYSSTQARLLVNSRVPAVIGTTQAVRDRVAAQLAINFYGAIAQGIGVDQSWQESILRLRTSLGEETRNYVRPPLDSEIQERTLVRGTYGGLFPWEIHYRQGDERIKFWNLPEAIADPYFGLPEPKTHYDLPNEPFRLLARYTRKDYHIFFGRGRKIKELMMKLTSSHSSPVIFLFGQSGVGKSSLLEAGLFPRLEVEHEIRYIRRNREVGLLGNLMDALNELSSKIELPVNGRATNISFPDEDIIELEQALGNSEGLAEMQLQSLIDLIKGKRKVIRESTVDVYGDLRDQWMKVEGNVKKESLIIILDQVEEVFTRPNQYLPNEMRDLFYEIAKIFNDSNHRPKGKLVLSFRKEFEANITKVAVDYHVPIEKVFLGPMEKKDIVEVIMGITSSPQLRQKYNLEIEIGLPRLIANSLLLDKDSPIAPVLQIILTKMWRREQGKQNHVFSFEGYGKLFESGILLSDFFNEQISEIMVWENEIGQDAANSGLVLDILYCHTTEFGTAESQYLGDLRQLYEHRSDILNQLINKLQDLHLLTRISADRTSLSHDTLAPIIHKEMKTSDRPGQVARRILENKMVDYSEALGGSLLEKSSLNLVEKGESGMRLWTVAEGVLIERSRKKRRWKNTMRGITTISLFLLSFASLAYFIQRTEISKDDEVRRLINQARLQSDSSRPNQALLSIQKALKIKPRDQGAIAARRDIYNNHEFFTEEKKRRFAVQSIDISSDGSQMLILENGVLHLGKTNEFSVNPEEEHSSIRTAVFHPSGTKILLGNEEGIIQIRDLDGGGKHLFEDRHLGGVNDITISSDGSVIATSGRDGSIKLWNSVGDVIAELSDQSAEVLTVSLSKDAKFLLSGNRDHEVQLVELKTMQKTLLLGHTDRILDVAFSHDGLRMASASRDGTIRIWSIDGTLLAILNEHQKRVNAIEFSPEDKHLLSSSDDHSVILWELRSFKVVRSYRGHQGPVNSIKYIADGEGFISASEDSTLKVWKLEPKVVQRFGPHPSIISSAAFSRDHPFLMTAPGKDLYNLSGQVNDTLLVGYLWDVKSGGLIRELSEYTSGTTEVLFRKDTIYTAGKDGKVSAWSLDGKRKMSLTVQKAGINALVLSPNGKMAITGGVDNKALIWDTQHWMATDTLGVHSSAVSAVQFSADGQRIFTAGYDSIIVAWTIEKEVLFKEIAHSKRIFDIAISPDGKYLLSGAHDNEARLWLINKRGLERIRTFTIDRSNFSGGVGINCVTFSNSGKYFAIGSEGGECRLYGLDGQHLQSFNDGGYTGVHCLAFSPDDKLLFVGYSDGWGRLYENLSAIN